jgi:hypothetical protein
VAIARFRLLLAAWRYCGVKRLRSAPDFKVNLAVGDSLLHGARFDAEGKPYTIDRESLFGGDELVFKDETAHHFEVEDAKELHRILGQQYHAVVGNPPYIAVDDPALKSAYKARYSACHGRWVLTVPFFERFMELALTGATDKSTYAGFVGKITGNNFIKREFGKKLIEEYIPKWDLTHIIDASGANIPGHNTPTIIVFGRNQRPTAPTIRTVMGINGEPSTPENPAEGLVWSSILSQIDFPGSETEWISISDTARDRFHKHPWSIGGGGAAELKEEIEDGCEDFVEKWASELGISAVTGEDEVYILPHKADFVRHRVEKTRPLVNGDLAREWILNPLPEALWLYDADLRLIDLQFMPWAARYLWPSRASISKRRRFGTPMLERGLTWYEWQEIYTSKLYTPLTITWGEVASHNNFVVDRGGKVFKNTAPVLKLKSDTNENDHIKLIGVMNSSTSCFWLRQVCFPKGGDHQGSEGARVRATLWDERFAFNSTQIGKLPIPEVLPLTLACKIECLAQELCRDSPEELAARDAVSASAWTEGEKTAADHRARMISLQEELDWQCYGYYGLIDTDDRLEWSENRLDGLPPLSLGERAFEIRMARQMAAGEFETAWFERHKDAGSKPITELPAHWPDDYRALVERRLAFIEANKNINLIERPEYKRRWNTEPWAKRQQAALEKWLLTRLETYFHDADRMVSGEDDATTTAKLAHIRPLRARFAGGTEPRLVSVRQLAQAAQADSQWMEAATVFAGRADFDVAKLVETLVLAESVPALPAQRYKPAGLRNRVEWEKTWELQRAEDAVEEEVRGRESGDRSQGSGVSEEELKKKIRKAQLEAVGDIPVPPKYGSGDFLKSSYWKLRGKLDVPKERWVLYPGMEGGHDASPVIAWAGWDHAQQAAALTAFYQQAKDTWGWAPERLAPLLAALKELLPWLHQWHNAIDPEYGDRPCDSFQSFYETERHTLRMTDEDIEGIRMRG